MKYNTGAVAIVAKSIASARHAILQYGVCDIPYPADDQITVIPSILIVTTEGDAVGMPPGIKWALVDGADPTVVLIMKARSGPQQRIDQVIQALNEEYAIDPRKLQS